jgi:hypothetical protein
MNSNKRGALGSGITAIMSVIAVIVILLVFIFASGFIRMMSEVNGGAKIYEGSKVGLGDVFHYTSSYLKLMDVRILVSNGRLVSQAISEAGYGK